MRNVSNSRRKLNHAIILLEQAKASIAQPDVFEANLNGFVEAARSVTFVMQSEFSAASGFTDWYEKKVELMKKDPDAKYFKELRTETVHIEPFRTPQRITTSFGPGGFQVKAGTTAIIPLGTVSEHGTIIPLDEEPASIDGHEIPVPRVTESVYQFSDRRDENALELCSIHLAKCRTLVEECEALFAV